MDESGVARKQANTKLLKPRTKRANSGQDGTRDLGRPLQLQSGNERIFGDAVAVLFQLSSSLNLFTNFASQSTHQLSLRLRINHSRPSVIDQSGQRPILAYTSLARFWSIGMCPVASAKDTASY